MGFWGFQVLKYTQIIYLVNNIVIFPLFRAQSHRPKCKACGIDAHHLWRENLGNVTEVFVNDLFGIVARTLRVCFPNSLVRISLTHFSWKNPSQKVWATNPKSSVNKPKGIVNKDLGYVSQIFLPKKKGNDPMPCG